MRKGRHNSTGARSGKPVFGRNQIELSHPCPHTIIGETFKGQHRVEIGCISDAFE